MKTTVDERLRVESATFALRFACEDCVHFIPRRAACLHGYPSSPHRADLAGDELEFCKEFELGEGVLEDAGLGEAELAEVDRTS